MFEFTQNLKKIRISKSTSQDELAKKIGIHPVQLSRYERGQTAPSIEVVYKIAEVLDVTIDELVYGDKNKKIESSIKDMELLSMFKKIQLLNDNKINTVKDFLSAYILKYDLQQKLA